jgi:hypothetical protein
MEKRGTSWRTKRDAFELSAEFPASLAKSGFRENLAPKVLDESIRLVSAVRLQNGSGS